MGHLSEQEDSVSLTLKESNLFVIDGRRGIFLSLLSSLVNKPGICSFACVWRLDCPSFWDYHKSWELTFQGQAEQIDSAREGVEEKFQQNLESWDIQGDSQTLFSEDNQTAWKVAWLSYQALGRIAWETSFHEHPVNLFIFSPIPCIVPAQECTCNVSTFCRPWKRDKERGVWQPLFVRTSCSLHP